MIGRNMEERLKESVDLLDDQAEQNEALNMSYKRQEISIFSGNRRLSGGSAAGREACLGAGGRMPDNVSLIEPARASGYAEGDGRGRGGAGWL